MMKDFAVAAGMLRRAPAFVIACVLSLAVGVGLNGTVFALLDAAMFRPPPYREPERLLTIQDSRRVPDHYLLSYDEVAQIDAELRGGARVGAYRAGMAYRHEQHLSLGAIQATGMAVTASVFAIVGVNPIVGRALIEEDERPDAAPVVVIGARLWRRAFDADRNILGATIRIDRRAYQVVGVMPDGFWFPSWSTEFWTPLSPAALGFSRSERSLSVVTRVAAGVSPELAARELTQRMSRFDPPNDRRARRWWRVDVFADVVRPGDGRLLGILQAVAAAVLFLACINVSNLMLVRASVRRREWAIRASLGASRWECVRPFVCEAIWLAIATAIVGGTLSLVAMRVVAATFDRGVLSHLIVGGTAHVLSVAFAAAVLSLIIGGTAPVLQVLASDARLALADGSVASGFGRGTRRLRNVAVALQVACSMVLCASTALLVRGLQQASAWNPGFDVHGLLMARLRSGGESGLAVPPSVLLGAARETPGVISAAAAQSFVPDEALIIGDAGVEANACACQLVSSDFLSTIAIPMLHGRAFTQMDAPDAGLVVVDERLSRTLWADPRAAVGRRLKLGSHGRWLTVAGVAAVTEFSRPPVDRALALPGLYVLSPAESLSRGTLFLRASPTARVADVLTAAARTIRSRGADEVADRLTTMEASLDGTLRPMRTYARLFGVLSMLALVLAVIGMNGVVGYHVVTTYRDLGIRAALGASPGSLFVDVIREAGRLATIGMATGILVAIAAGRIVTSSLLDREVGFGGPLTIAAAVLAAASLAAALPAALRAARVPPSCALRG